jgi:hypothetical protein
LEPSYKTTFCKIKKNQAVKCQIIRIIIKKEKTHVYIQLYQKNPRIKRKDRTYSDKVICFLILVDKDFKYIQSTTGKKTKTGIHICIEANLDPGVYYIYSDVNYRNKHSENNHGYMISFYSSNIVNDSSKINNETNSFENVTERVDDPIEALRVSMYYYCKMNNIECKDDGKGIIIFDSKHSNEDMPFRILCFVNPTMNPFKVSLTIEGNKKNFCIYNDEIAREFDTSVIKEIKPRNATSILIWENNLIDECKPVYEILDGNDTRTYESVHPIFDKEGKKQYDIDNLLKYYSKVNDGKGFILGLENTSEFSFKLNLKLEGAYDIDNNRELFGKDDITFVILPKEKRVFNAKNKSDVNGHDYSIKRID